MLRPYLNSAAQSCWQCLWLVCYALGKEALGIKHDIELCDTGVTSYPTGREDQRGLKWPMAFFLDYLDSPPATGLSSFLGPLV